MSSLVYRSSPCFIFVKPLDLLVVLAERSDNFIIGLTDVSPTVTAPTLWNYAICGQYTGAVGLSATVTMECSHDMPAYRYLIVQFPRTDYANFCELEVYIRRKFTNYRHDFSALIIFMTYFFSISLQ